MTAALARRCPGAVVENVDVGAVVDGTNRRARVSLLYADGGGPDSVFVKWHGRMTHRLALLALRAWAAEARLADCGGELPLEHPVAFAAGVDRPRHRTIVVMDDVTTTGGRPNSATEALEVPEVRAGLEGLARLHAAYWDRPLPPGLAFLRHWRLSARWAPISAASLHRGLRLLRHPDRLGPSGPAGRAVPAMPAGLHASCLERQFRRSAALAASGPQTVLHGDPHPGNTYALPGSRTGFYDWQLVRTGHWSHDVGYFLVSSLDIDDRRRHEKELLGNYLDGLGRGGVAPPAMEHAWARYRATPAFGLCTWLHTLSFGSLQPADVCLTTLGRFASAYGDLETDHSLLTGY